MFSVSTMSIPVLKTVSVLRSKSVEVTQSWSLFLGMHAILLQLLTSLILVVAVCMCFQRTYRKKLRRRRRERRHLREEYMRILRFLQDCQNCQTVNASDNFKETLIKPCDNQVCSRNVDMLSTISSKIGDNQGTGSRLDTPSSLPTHLAALPSYDEISGVWSVFWSTVCWMWGACVPQVESRINYMYSHVINGLMIVTVNNLFRQIVFENMFLYVEVHRHRH